MYRVSVIIPVYNRAALLERALHSVAQQSRAADELIVVDDGSTDDAKAVAKAFHCRYLCLAHCGYPGKVRNAGVDIATGDMLAFLDSDDQWLEEKLRRQLAFHQESPQIQISHTREIWIRQRKKVSQASQNHRRSGKIFTDAVKKCIMGPSTIMMDREKFLSMGGFREDLEIAEDYEFFLRVTDLYAVGYLDEPLCIKHAGLGDNLSEKYEQIEGFRIAGLELLLQKKRLTAENEAIATEELARKYRIFARGAEKRNKDPAFFLQKAEHYESMRGR